MISLFFNTFKLFTWDIFLSLGYWPIWWYSKGLLEFVVTLKKSLQRSWYNLGLGILLSSWFKPMYGQQDWQGRIISFVFRTLMIFYKAIFFIVWFSILLACLVLWVVLPAISLVVIFMIIIKGK